MLGLKLFRRIIIMPERIKTLRMTPNSPEKIKALMQSFREEMYSSFEIELICMYLNDSIGSFSEYPGLLASIKDLYDKNQKLYDDSTLCVLFWLAKKKNSPDQKFFVKLLQKLESKISELSIKNFIYVTEGCVHYPHLIPDDFLQKIQEKIKSFEGKYDSRELNLICNSYNKIYRQSIEDIEVFQVLEREILRFGTEVPTETILSFLICLNKIIIRHPSDVPNMMQILLVSRAKALHPDILCRLLNVFSMSPLFYQYTNLYISFEKVIVENPDDYFVKVPMRSLSIAHAYSKLEGFHMITRMFIGFMPRIPKEILDDCEALGYLLNSLLIKYPGDDYENMLVNTLFENAYKISDMRKKKIVIDMMRRKSLCRAFWENIQSLEVLWTPKDLAHFIEFKEELEKYGLLKAT
ncbi:hypothetical protein SteCoe_18161 [Stentor coeruleus]|uniref:FAST kinase leucine-rich domain-containing protein n=1 Tax=Stentor coeruleus TaxID=5963 RepID=A0A1R2BXE5_9CILI|nr:hypothetical protein SteCoe_18161 [Stentor coeruleus]